MQPSIDQFAGCLLGLASGDALGAPLEGGAIERFVWRLIGRTRSREMRWTDDTQMSLDLADSLIANEVLDLDDLATRFAASYRWHRGYGPGAARLLKRIARGMDWREANRSVYTNGSYGNGGAMRAPIVGLFFASAPDQLVSAARDSARITHAHPLGIEGAVLIAASTARALADANARALLDSASAVCAETAFLEKLTLARSWIDSERLTTPAEVRARLGCGMAAIDSCVTAVYLAARFLSATFDELIRFVAACGGDTDTIGAMSGAIWGTANGVGALPEPSLRTLEGRVRIQATADELFRSRARANYGD
ncbi:MAG: ADP-ribosylglycohydrolase family protein [Planctomycetota bacterium]